MTIGVNIEGLVCPDGAPAMMTGISHYTDSLLTTLSHVETSHSIHAFSFGATLAGLQASVEKDRYLWLREGRIPVTRAEIPPVRASAGLLRYADKARRRVLRFHNLHQASQPFDLIHLPNAIGIFAPAIRPKRLVGTIYDMTVRTRPEAHLPETIKQWEAFFRMAQRRFDRVITISEHARSEIAEILRIPRDRIAVTPLAPRLSTRRVADPEIVQFILTRYGLCDVPFVLYAGTLEPRKNLRRLVGAFALACQERDFPGDVRLVLAGGKWNDYDQEIQRTAQKTGVAARLQMTGYVPDEDMNVLMSSCAAFAYVSLGEGFGLPPLEAMVCGAPVITSNVTSLPEVVGEAGLQVAPQDISEIAAALYTLLTDANENQRRRELSEAQARLFSWERTAQLTLDAYEAALA